jgi:hypothetical protein
MTFFCIYVDTPLDMSYLIFLILHAILHKWTLLYIVGLDGVVIWWKGDGLDPECPPKFHVFKAWSPTCGTIGRRVETLRGGA